MSRPAPSASQRGFRYLRRPGPSGPYTQQTLFGYRLLDAILRLHAAQGPPGLSDTSKPCEPRPRYRPMSRTRAPVADEAQTRDGPPGESR